MFDDEALMADTLAAALQPMHWDIDLDETFTEYNKTAEVKF